MIHAKSIERIFYNAGNGYTVATYQTEEELPKKLSVLIRETPDIFRQLGLNFRPVTV